MYSEAWEDTREKGQIYICSWGDVLYPYSSMILIFSLTTSLSTRNPAHWATFDINLDRKLELTSKSRRGGREKRNG
jgi:hypothetical protein